MYDFHVVINGWEGYRRVRDFLHDYLIQLLPSDHFLLEVALNEAICNSIQNGSLDQGHIHVELKIRVLNKRKLIIRIKDHGPGFSGNQDLVQLQKHPESLWNQEQLLSESGRGLCIMNHAADYITYNRKGNELLLVKNLTLHQSFAFN